MHDLSEARWDEAAPAQVSGSLRLAARTLVSQRVTAPGERNLQAHILAVLLVLGLVTATASPLAAAAGATLAWILGPILASGLFLSAATALAITGRLDAVLSAVFAVLAAAATLLGARLGLYAPLLVMAAAPLEATLAGRRPLAVTVSGILLLCAAVLGAAAVAGLAVRQSADSALFVAACGLPLLLRMVAEVSRRGAALGEARHVRRAERDTLIGAERARLLRFAPDGTVMGDAAQMEAALGSLAANGDILQAIHVQDRLSFLKAFNELRAGAPAASAAIRVADADDRFRSVSLRLLPVRNRKGALRSVLALLDDRTEHQENADRLAAALASAEGASVAKSQFLAAVSHELRTPLNAIIGFSEILDQEFFGGFQTPKQKEYVGLIRKSGEHLLQLVNGLLDVSKIEAGRYELHPEPFVIGEAVEAAAGMMRAEAERKGLSLTVRVEGEAEFTADRKACQQILLNLLSNAVKFTDEGGVTLDVRRESGALRFAVSDTGIGIEAGDIARLGRPFVQVSSGLSRRYGGTGLGLSLVRGFVELHGGTMGIESSPGGGTRVTISLPDNGAERLRHQRSLNENIVTLTDARKKARHSPQASAQRQSA